MANRGYTKIENDLFEFLYRNNLTASELKILLLLIRFTKGFNRQTTRAAYSYISQGTGYSMETCRKAIKSLCEKGVLEIEYSAIGSKAQVLKVLYKNCTTSYTTLVPPLIQAELDDKVQAQYHQDIKEDIKDIYIKDKEKASPSFSDENDDEESIDDWVRRVNEEGFDD